MNEKNHEPNKPRSRFMPAALGIIATGALAVFGTAFAFGASQGHGPGHMGERMQRKIERALERVDATPQQREAAASIIDDFVANMTPLREELKEDRKALRAELVAEDIDADAIEALRTDVVSTMNKSSVVMTDALVAFAQVLEPEQRVALAEAMESRRGRHGRRRH